jgi:glycosyltransferase involved in cell wall biosynthesis
MRVAILSHNARASDAIGNLLAEKVAFFLERGADVRVFVEDDRRLHLLVGRHCRLVSNREPDGSVWEYLLAADLIIIEYGMAYGLLQWLPLLARAGKRILFDYHGITPPSLWNGPQREALEQGQQQRGLVWFAEAAVVHSRFAALELQAPTRFPSERLHVLAHPVDTERFRPGPPQRSLAEELGLAEAHLLLFVGRIAPNKNVPILVDALKFLADVKPPVHLVIAGDAGDVYQNEAEHCRRRAFELGVFDRVHFLGQVSDERLPDLYRSASLFVMPSRHEGFCIPVLEAMASGLPVLAARAGALPETVDSAGLTFAPGDSVDLARQARRVLRQKKPQAVPQRLRVAVVSFRYGPDIVGGAEGSLRTMARALHSAGHDVQVYTTCTLAEGDWSNELAEGTIQDDGIPVHRSMIDAHDRARHHETIRKTTQSEEAVSAALGEEYLHHSIHSTRLIDALRSRIDDFDAIVTGPYLFGLTADVARSFPEKTILVPCFHAEPMVRLPVWHDSYQGVGAILYHSPEELELAQTDLGLNHPGSCCLGTLINTQEPGNADRGRQAAATDRRYLVYCGRYSQQKNLPLLLDYLGRYQAERPLRFSLVCVGRGEVALPAMDWLHDVGFVDEARKGDLLAGADALVQLSRFESLSLVALEAWAQGTPVMADAACAPLAGLVRRSGGGRTVADYASFAAALDDLWEQPDRWRHFGEEGQAYVRRHFGDARVFLRTLEDTVRDLTTPLAEKMRRQGLARAAVHDRGHWRERFGFLVERLLDQPQTPCHVAVEVRPRVDSRTVRAGSGTTLVPVTIENRGSHPVVAEGAGRMTVRALFVGDDGCPFINTPLPGIIVPGQQSAAAVRVPVPARAGCYRVELKVVDEGSTSNANRAGPAFLRLNVEANGPQSDSGCLAEALSAVHTSLADAERRQRLPDDYLDVTEGFLARSKRWIKSKLLGNFKHAYVDVLSRQQSGFNRAVLVALQELCEGSSLLDHAQAPLADLPRQVAELLQRQVELERRLAHLESSLPSALVADHTQE